MPTYLITKRKWTNCSKDTECQSTVKKKQTEKLLLHTFRKFNL